MTRKEKYYRYLNTKTWKDKRMLVLRRDKFACQKCESKENLQIHHLTYDRVFNEKLNDLITLCYLKLKSKICHRQPDSNGQPSQVNYMGCSCLLNFTAGLCKKYFFNNISKITFFLLCLPHERLRNRKRFLFQN